MNPVSAQSQVSAQMGPQPKNTKQFLLIRTITLKSWYIVRDFNIKNWLFCWQIGFNTVDLVKWFCSVGQDTVLSSIEWRSTKHMKKCGIVLFPLMM